MTANILVVEDSRTQAEALQTHLESAGYAVTIAAAGEDALQVLERNGFDLVLSDIVMPGAVDGYELCRRIKAGEHRELPVVLLTSLSDPADIIHGLECGADNFLTKPYQPEVLIDRIELLLRNRRLRSRERLKAGVKLFFMGQEYVITSEREQILDLLISTFEDAVQQNRELRRREAELTNAKAELARYARSLEAQLDRILHSVPDVVFSLSPDWQKVHYVSPAARNVFGCEPDAFSLDYWKSHVLAEDRDRVVEEVTRSVRLGSPRTFEYRFAFNGGPPHWIFQTMIPVREDEDSIVRLDGIARDVTEHHQMAAGLRESEERVRLLLESTAEGVCGLDLNGCCTFCNRAAARLLGYADSAELLGRNLHALVHHSRPDGSPYPQEECPVHRALATGSGTHGDDEVLWRADGTTFPIEYWAHPIWRGGEFVGCVVTFVDITERKSLEAQVRQAQKLEAVGRLAGGVAHDFNNLLTVILGETELALMGSALDAESTEALEEVRGAAERAKLLTRQLLTFSRREIVEPTVFSLNELVQGMETMLRRLIGEDIQLVPRLAPELGAVRADRSQLEQVLMNLVVNARDAMPAGGSLVIETANVTLPGDDAELHVDVEAGPYVLLAVSDTGTGMSEEVQTHIFEPFFTTKARDKGTGLGLATSYGIVKQGGGHIGVYSELGVGTTMKVYLPRVAATVEPVAADGTPAPTGSETVLLVEDDEHVRRTAARMLRAHGYQVLEANDGPAAREIAASHAGPIHLLVVDVVLPTTGGRELAQQIRAARPGIKVLFASGYTEDIILHHVLEQGITLIQKPFTPEALARKVREVLDRQAQD